MSGFAITREEAEVLCAVAGIIEARKAVPCKVEEYAVVFGEIDHVRIWADLVSRLAGALYQGDKPS